MLSQIIVGGANFVSTGWGAKFILPSTLSMHMHVRLWICWTSPSWGSLKCTYVPGVYLEGGAFAPLVSTSAPLKITKLHF